MAERERPLTETIAEVLTRAGADGLSPTELAEEVKAPMKHVEVALLHMQHPGLSTQDIADRLGISRQRVGKIKKVEGLSIPRGRPSASAVLELVAPSPAEIRDWRREHGDMSQQSLADMLGVLKDTVSRWERGLMKPHPMLSLALRGLECGEQPAEAVA